MRQYFKKSVLLPATLFIVHTLVAQTMELSLQEALQLASKGNRTLQMQVLQSLKAAEVLKETKSYMLPSVSAGTAYNIYGERPVIFFRNEAASPKLNEVRFGGRFAFDGIISADYPLLNPGIQSGIRSAGIDREIEKHKVKNTEEQLALDITRHYLAIQMNREQGRLLEQSLDRNEQALKDSRALFLQGKNLKTDTLSNYIVVQNLKASISMLENNSYILILQLKQMMGVDEGVSLLLTENFFGAVEEDMGLAASDGISLALNNRSDIRIQNLEIDRAKEKIKSEKSIFLPALRAVAQYQVQNQADNFPFGKFGFPGTSFVGVRLSIPVYSGNRQRYKSQQAKLSVEQSELALEELRNSVSTELVSLQSALQEAVNQWHIRQQNVQAAEINFRMMNDRYRHGLGSRLELTDAELALTAAKLENLKAIYSIRITRLQLKKAMGMMQLNG